MSSFKYVALMIMVFSLSFSVTKSPFATQLPMFLPHANLQRSNLIFTFKSGADGKTSDGADFSAVSYESSDGIVVSAITETYTIKGKAERALQKRLRGASRILSRVPKISSTGKQVGTRIVVLFPHEDQYRSKAMIFWTDGSELHSIGAASLRHVREFEKTFY